MAGGEFTSPALTPSATVRIEGRGAVPVRDLAGPPGAPALMLIHGWTVSADLNWFTVLDALADRYRVVSFDLAGHGRRERDHRRFRLSDAADDVVAVADALGIDTFCPVGYSMGGAVAQLLWQRHRARVAGLVLCATACRFSSTFVGRTQLAAFGPAATVTRIVPDKWLGHAFTKVVRHRTRRLGFGDWAVEEVLAGDPRRVLEAGRELHRFDSRGWIPAVDVPSSVLVMDSDSILAPVLQNELATLLPGAHVVHVDGDHDVCVRGPERFRAALLDGCAFVAEHKPAIQ